MIFRSLFTRLGAAKPKRRTMSRSTVRHVAHAECFANHPAASTHSLFARYRNSLPQISGNRQFKFPARGEAGIVSRLGTRTATGQFGSAGPHALYGSSTDSLDTANS